MLLHPGRPKYLQRPAAPASGGREALAERFAEGLAEALAEGSGAPWLWLAERLAG